MPGPRSKKHSGNSESAALFNTYLANAKNDIDLALAAEFRENAIVKVESALEIARANLQQAYANPQMKNPAVNKLEVGRLERLREGLEAPVDVNLNGRYQLEELRALVKEFVNRKAPFDASLSVEEGYARNFHNQVGFVPDYIAYRHALNNCVKQSAQDAASCHMELFNNLFGMSLFATKGGKPRLGEPEDSLGFTPTCEK